MPLDQINAHWTNLLSSPEFSGLAGLVNLSAEDYDVIRREMFVAAEGEVSRVITGMGLYPAVALVGMSRAAQMAYDGDNFWENFGTEVGITIPVNRRAELKEAFCRAAARTIAGFHRAHWEGWSHAGEFLVQAGLPLHHCSTFARVLRLAVDDTGLPDAQDSEGIQETIERMLSRSELSGQKVIQKALRGPAGPLLVEAAVAAISAGDFDRFNSELAKALHESFESHPRHATGQTLRRPFLQLDRDRSRLELNCPYPPAALCGGQGIVWSINGERHRAAGGQGFLYPLRRMVSYTVELHGLHSGRSVKWAIDARPDSGPRGFSAFSAETGRHVRLEESEEGLMLAPGDYYLLHASRWACDEATDQVEWNEDGFTLTQVSIRPGDPHVFYDGDKEVTVSAAKSVWLEAAGKSFTTSAEEKKVHYGWEEWPRLWIDADANAEEWTTEISSAAFSATVMAMPLGLEVGGLRAHQLSAPEMLRRLPPGLHRIIMTVRQRDRIRHRQEWLLWIGLTEASGTGFTWSSRPMNLLEESVRGFVEAGGGFAAGSTEERVRQIVFRMGPETMALKWLREGISVEACEVTAGARNTPQPCSLGSTHPADEFSKTQLRISIVPAKIATLLVNGKPFKKGTSANGFMQFDVSLASVAALYPEGGEISVVADGELETVVARFSRPVVASLAALTSDHDYKTLRCLIGQPIAACRVRVREMISGLEVLTEGMPLEATGEACIRPNELPRVKCANTGPQKLHGYSGFGLVIGVGETKWPEGVWWIEVEVQSRPESSWETLRDTKGGCLPLLVVQNPTQPPDDYRSHALWWGLANRGSGGAFPAKLPSADGNATRLNGLLCEISALLKDRISEHVMKKQFAGLFQLRNELSRQVNWLIEDGNSGAADGVVAELNAEDSTATPRSLIFSTPTVVALPTPHLERMAEGDMLRTCLLWCGRLAAAETVAGGFHRLEIDPAPALGAACPGEAAVLKFFRNGNRMRPNGTLPNGEEFTGFDFRRYFEHLGRARINPDTTPAAVQPLSSEHFGYAIRSFRERRNAAEACASLSNVNTVFSRSNLIAKELANRLPQYRPLMPQGIWMRPWPEISVDDDNLAEVAVQFASVYALMTRLAGDKRLSFRDFNKWMRTQTWLGPDQTQAVNHATTTLICKGPELFGFFLMFWQLMIQTYPHD